MAVLPAGPVSLARSRTAVGADRARIALRSAVAVRIISVGQAIMVIVTTVAARGFRWWGGGAAVGRATALSFACITGGVAAQPGGGPQSTLPLR